MKIWQRIVFSMVSLIFGFVSLDYLYLAFGLLTNQRESINYSGPKQEVFIRLAGAVLFLVWFIILAAYAIYLRGISQKIDLVEEDTKTGQQRIKRKWFDIIFQYAFIFTGAVIRWGYLNIFYFPNQ